MKQKPELKKGTGSVNSPIPVGFSRALEGIKLLHWIEQWAGEKLQKDVGAQNVALNPLEIAAGGISSSSQILSPLRFLMVSKTSAAGKECHLLSDTLNSNNNWPRLVLGLCWSQG